MSRRVVITGMGWITPLGHDLESVWHKLLAGESGVAKTTNFDASTYPTQFSAEVKNFDLAAVLGDAYQTHKNAARHVGFALAAADQAWKHAGLDRAPVSSEMVGVYLGGGDAAIDFDNFAYCGVNAWDGENRALDDRKWASLAQERFNAAVEFEQDPACAASHIAYRFDAEGPNLNTLTACSASTQAIGEATEIIRRGDADLMISGGAHSMIHPLGVTGFNRLTALSERNDSPETASRPFNRTRDGFVLGEGAGILILEDYETASRRGANILAELVGYGSTADAFRVTDIHESARGAMAAMNMALGEAEMTIADIDYISAHGTGTHENDKLETLAIRSVFGDRAPQVPVSSIKSMMGHLVAAAGAVELMTCVLALRDQILPPTANYTDPDPNCDLDYVPNKPREADVRACLSNSFGFGGQNDTLIVKR